MQNTSTQCSPASCRILLDRRTEQDGQFIDMDFMASRSTTCRRWPWQKSMDSQDFGFASSLKKSRGVLAPADELFFEGQLLPLQVEHRQDLVKEFFCEQKGSRRGSSNSTRISNSCKDEEEVTEDHSCCIGNKAGALNTGHGNLSQAEGYGDQRQKWTADRGTCYIPGSNNVKEGYHCRAASTSNLMVDSWCKDKGTSPSRSVRIRSASVLEDKESHGLLHPERSLCDQETTRSWRRLSIWSTKTVEVPTKLVSPSYTDEERTFHSCRVECKHIDADFKARMLVDLQSSSFRSQSSGFWDSGPDKDSADSSSSRNSNGSSQDSYFPSSRKLEATLSAPQHPHIKASFHIPWKSLFRKPYKRQSSSCSLSSSSSQQAFCRKYFSEDLSAYALCAAPPIKGAEEPVVSQKPMRSAPNDQSSRYNLGNHGKGMGTDSRNGRSEEGCRGKAVFSEEVQTHSNAQSRSSVMKGKGGREDAEKESMLRDEDLKERHWLGYTRRLKQLCAMKKGIMGPFGLDECGKGAACEVECDRIHARRRAIPTLQRRLSYQSSLFDSHELTMQESHRGNYLQKTRRGRSSTLVMSSCPPSTRGSPKRTGLLVRKAMNSGAKIFDDAGTKCSRNRSHSSNKPGMAQASNGFLGSNSTSLSTMHELHSSLQSAIAHCKESNQRH